MLQRFVLSMLFVAILVQTMFAQKDTIIPQIANLTYVGFGVAKPFGVSATATHVRGNGWGGSLSIQMVSPEAKNLPSDYRKASSSHSDFGDYSGWSDGPVSDYVNFLSLRVVKEFRTQSPHLRYGFEAGPTYVRAKVAENFTPDSGLPNYSYQHNEYKTVGLSLRAKAVFTLLPMMGIEIAVSSNLNNRRSYVGLEALLNLGKVR